MREYLCGKEGDFRSIFESKAEYDDDFWLKSSFC